MRSVSFWETVFILQSGDCGRLVTLLIFWKLFSKYGLFAILEVEELLDTIF